VKHLKHTLAIVLSVAVAGLLPWSHAHAQDANLLVKHWTRSTGSDGITRTVEYSERVYRRSSQLWIERVLPADVHSVADHVSAGSDHRHIDASTAARWISRDADGTLHVRLVPPHDGVVVEVSKTDYANIGFDGSWDAAWHLMDPAALKRLVRHAPNGDLVRYDGKSAEQAIKVVWSQRGGHPMSVLSTAGLTQRRTTVQAVAAPHGAPWERLGNLTRKDYSDYLD